ncbi:efflux RND transporter periplasmic adaptor subunit [Coraliomargarita parva]|uniref:efflux RND transporter periplasmic adaptor subunit n=1 Tax=Coraliomargarita parva TaxID=3014050 RepID=UPI0022B394DA|nr:efflux RND transporter periplasmic adaptor subunit [Coraliomargarita parva]
MRTILPLFILAAALLATAALIHFKPEAKVATPQRPVTTIEVLTVEPATVQLTVSSQGTVLPRTETNLVVEVSGQIIEVADNFRAGGRFTVGDVLLRIDPADYKAAVAARAADLANAELALAQEKALGEQALADWKALGKGTPSDLTLRKPQLAQAQALADSAEAALERARRDLDRTELKAPYGGRVLSKSVDLGQYVIANPANPIATIFATDIAEIRLPITEHEASFLQDPEQAPATVHLSAGTRQWTGRLVRLEASLDTGSRLLSAIVEVNDAFANTEQTMRRGLFVDAVIEGRTINQAYELPRYALRGSDTVYVLTDEATLVTHTVEIVKSDINRIVVQDGLNPGDQVATSPIAYYVENMPVRVLKTE